MSPPPRRPDTPPHDSGPPSPAPPNGAAPPVPRRRAWVVVLLLVPLLVAAVLWAFAWPASRAAPNDLPLGVAGPQEAVAPAEEALQQAAARQGARFSVHRYEDAERARAGIEEREVYGALVVTEEGTELLVASAASPVVAQMVTEIAVSGAPRGQSPRITDVVPAPEHDPRGAAFGAGVLPLAIAGVMTGAATAMLDLRGLRAVGAVAGASVIAGAVCTALLHSWLGVVEGRWLTVAAGLALMIAAIAAAVAGAVAFLGPPGIGVAALLMVLFGNPFSGATSAPELLPGVVGDIGRWLPPGAGASLLRSVSFFDGHGAGFPVLVLGLWLAVGVAAMLLGPRWRRATPARVPVPGPA